MTTPRLEKEVALFPGSPPAFDPLWYAKYGGEGLGEFGHVW